MKLRIPKPLQLEHEELHTELVKALKIKGGIGKAARAVAEKLHPHFIKEEEYALPPLGLLAPLAGGKSFNQMKEVIAMTDRLKKDLPEMLEEHKAIVAELKKLISVAKKEKKLEYVHFAEKLMLHAQTEEEVMYPASLLIGEYLKLIFGSEVKK